MKRLPPFDKYEYYRRAVQDPEAMCDFLWNVYRDASRRSARTLREDFCGDFGLCAEWVKRDSLHEAVAIDNAAEPLAAGKARWWPELDVSQRKRLLVKRGDVLKTALPEADIACAFNFSYCTFHSRAELRRYFERCHRSLRPRGLFFLDVLPANETTRQIKEEMQFGDFLYVWEQERFDPITRRAVYHIHFQRPGEKRRKRVFTYDWRMWTIPELRDLLEECGFRKSWVFWEGVLADDSGEVTPENCENWVACIVAAK